MSVPPAAPAPGAAVARQQELVLSEHLDLMLRQMHAVFAGNFLAAALTPFALWNLSDRASLMGWAAAVVLLTLVCLTVVLRYRKAPPPLHARRRWAWMFAGFSALFGVLWGGTALLFYDPVQPLTVVYVGIILAGMAGGSVASLSNFLPAYFAFAITIVLPFMAQSFIVGGTIYTTFGFLAIVTLAINLSYSRNINHTIGESIRLRFANVALIEQLQNEKTIAENANRAKTVFLAAVSHDLRQPSHALGLFVQALLAGGRREGGVAATEVQRLGERMQVALREINGLLNGVLDVSRLDAGVVSLKPQPLALAEALANSATTYAAEAADKGLTLRLRPTTLTAVTDLVLFTRIVSNLISNAVKYTDHGGVFVAARRRGREICVEVWDTGHGIAAEQIEQIFEEFVQLENPSRDRNRGLGLGLAIVRRSAALLDHRIEVRSVPKRGSCFRIWLQGAPADVASAAAPPANPRDLVGAPILVIDDDRSVRDATAALLLSWGSVALTATDAAEAIALATAANPPPRAIIADYRLAGGNTGSDAIRRVNAALHRPLPALIITGDTSPERLRETAASGYRILHKPFDPVQLLQELQTLLA